jgi:hypothetical protein
LKKGGAKNFLIWSSAFQTARVQIQKVFVAGAPVLFVHKKQGLLALIRSTIAEIR